MYCRSSQKQIPVHLHCLQTVHKKYEDFKEAMTFALKNSKGFWLPLHILRVDCRGKTVGL